MQTTFNLSESVRRRSRKVEEDNVVGVEADKGELSYFLPLNLASYTD